MKSSFVMSVTAAAALLLGTLGSSTASAQGSGLVFPTEPEEIITLPDDRRVEVYKATVERVRGNRLTVRFPHGERHTYEVPSDFRFKVDGRDVSVRQLRRGEELTAYVTLHEDDGHEIHHIPEPAAAAPVVRNTVRAQPMPDPVELPGTASPLPLIGLLGALSLGLGGLGFALRRRMD